MHKELVLTKDGNGGIGKSKSMAEVTRGINLVGIYMRILYLKIIQPAPQRNPKIPSILYCRRT